MTAPVVLRREMSISHREFLRSLVPAVAPATFEVTGESALTITVQGAPGDVTIRVSAERERRIALLALPVVDVEIELTGFEAQAYERFMRQFDRAFQRGGG